MLIRRETPEDVARIDGVRARPLAAWHPGLAGTFRDAAPFEAL